MVTKLSLKLLSVAVLVIGISMGVINFTSAQSIKTDYVNSNRMEPNEVSPIGCYNYVILDCGLDIGQELICEFTGSYGPPYSCQGYDCYGGEKDRHCVQGQ